MSRVLRGVAARRAPLAVLFTMTVVVVTGTVAVVGFADQAGTSRLVAVPLLLLGLVAVPGTGRELGSVRRDEIGLARLHGLRGASLVTLLTAEPLLAMTAGALVGLPLGALASWAAGQAWLDDPGGPVGWPAVGATAAIVLVGVVVVLFGMARAIREPLGTQLGTPERPHPAGVVGLFGSLLVLAAAAVSLYRSTVVSADDPDWVVLVGPAVVGLAVGQLAVWALQLAARFGIWRTARSATPSFLASRRLGRSLDRVSAVRLLVAATTLAAVALTGAAAVDGWTDRTARLRNGAPLQVALDPDAGGTAALALTQRVDPEGRWLMAAVVVPADAGTTDRRAFVDTSRYDRVVGDFLEDTPAAGVGDDLEALAPGEPPAMGLGDEVQLLARVIGEEATSRLRVTLDYVDDANVRTSQTTELPVVGGVARGPLQISGCDDGCVVQGAALARGDRGEPVRVLVESLRFGESELVGDGWEGGIVTDDGLDVVVPASGKVTLRNETLDVTLPVLTTPGVSFLTPDEVNSPGGNARRTTVVGEHDALPLVDGAGVLGDLPRSLVGASSTIPAAEVLVLARADTPAEVLDELGGSVRSIDELATATAAESGAVQARMYVLIAVACLPVALLVLASAGARQRAQVTRELAALRLIRVPAGELRGAARTELGWLVATVLVSVAVGTVAAVLVQLPDLPLVTAFPLSTPVDTGVAALPLVATLGIAAAATWWLGGRARRAPERATRPAGLREGSEG